MDKDGSGSIDFGEFREYFSSQVSGFKAKNQKLEQELNKRIEIFFSSLYTKLKKWNLSL
jgi:Ca2+-binding EF-hand superfamily protein